MRWITRSAPNVAYVHGAGVMYGGAEGGEGMRWVKRFALNVACTSCTAVQEGNGVDGDGWWQVGSQSRQTSAESADSRFSASFSFGVGTRVPWPDAVPLGEDGGLQSSRRVADDSSIEHCSSCFH